MNYVSMLNLDSAPFIVELIIYNNFHLFRINDSLIIKMLSLINTLVRFWNRNENFIRSIKSEAKENYDPRSSLFNSHTTDGQNIPIF